MIEVKYVDKLHPVFTKPKRIKIVVGGRGSTKSTGIADYVAACISQGQLWCCAREHQNSIEESVHRTILDEIGRLGLPGFTDTKTEINHISGGRTFYRGLSRNITSLKSTLSGIDGLWIEEGEDLSDNTLRVLTASVRLNATDTERAIAGEDVKMPEIIITMNRGARAGAVAQKWLARAENELKRCGYYEDDLLMVVELNYTDMPESWFKASGLEQERLDDYQNLTRAEYDHKWGGGYFDTVPNSIIQPEWFDAAIDAHEKLNFTPRGIHQISHDPADSGDAKALAERHGSVVLDVDEITTGDVNDALDWALGKAISKRVDLFNWDCDGLGISLKRQVRESLQGKKTNWQLFKGSEGPDRPEMIFDGDMGDRKGQKAKNKEIFRNKRAQYYWKLRERFRKTYQAVEQGKYSDPQELISISSKIKHMTKLRSEVCSIPRKYSGNGLIQIMPKKEMMVKFELPSPNMADALMMLFRYEEKPVATHQEQYEAVGWMA